MTKEEKCSTTQVGRIVIHKDNCEKRVYKDELDTYLKDGWSIGVSDKHRKSTRKSHLGHTPWNKGIPCSEETKKKLSVAVKNSDRTFWNKGLTKETSDKLKASIEKGVKTKVDRYGSAFHNNNMDAKHKANISKANKGKPNKYKGKKREPNVGVNISKAKLCHTVSQETREKISKSKVGVKLSKERQQQRLDKCYETHKKNNSFNTSNPEKKLYEELLESYKGKTILREYKDKERYPYYCDFYVVEDDLFIELNAHWTHGGKPFDENDEECIAQLNEWKIKAKQSKFYEIAINTWTVRDVEKMKCAKEHNLNYKVIY